MKTETKRALLLAGPLALVGAASASAQTAPTTSTMAADAATQVGASKEGIGTLGMAVIGVAIFIAVIMLFIRMAKRH